MRKMALGGDTLVTALFGFVFGLGLLRGVDGECAVPTSPSNYTPLHHTASHLYDHGKALL